MDRDKPDKQPVKRLVILDIDGLRQDVLANGLETDRLPNLGCILGGAQASHGLHINALSCAPSITFSCQSSIFTGTHPDQHGIAGNQFFDRFGRHNGGTPRFYAFDIGDALAVEDAVLVFTGKNGLLGETISSETPTLYEMAAANGLSSTVVHNMVARGATHWIKPNLMDIARFTKGGGLLGLGAEAYDGEMLAKACEHLRAGFKPDILTLYFMGLDHHSHQHGPQAQDDYLARVVDVQIGRLLAELQQRNMMAGTLFAIISDHGQIGVIPDKRHSLRMSYPFEREMAYLFDALGLDVNDKPGESFHSHAVVACNGGLAHIYLKNPLTGWSEPPRFVEDVQRVAKAFWEAHQYGAYAADMAGSLALVLVRNTARDGWDADYQAFTAEGEVIPIEEAVALHPAFETSDASHRLAHLAGPMSGDLLLVSNSEEGFYFGGPITGVHGGLQTGESKTAFSLGWPEVSPELTPRLRQQALDTLESLCAADGNRQASIADLVAVIRSIMGLF